MRRGNAIASRGGCADCAAAGANCCGGCCDCKGGGSVYGGAVPAVQPLECLSCAPPSIVYFNMSLFNPASASVSIPAQVIDTRSTAILARPDDWEMSVVRFDISAQLLPPMVLPMPPLPPPPPAPQPATVPTLLTVTLRFAGIDYQQTVSIGYGGPATYGFVYAFDELTVRINAAFAAAFALIPGLPVGAQPPFLYFDPGTQMFRLFFQTAVYGAAPLAEIWLSHTAYKYLASMPAFFAGINQPAGKDFRLQVERDSAVLIPAPPGPGYPVLIQGYAGAVAFLTQAGPSLAATNGVRSIYLSSNLLPINSEGLPTTSSPGQDAGYSSNSTPILSDFLLTTEPATNPVVDRISVSYLPSAEYRMIQLRGAEPIKQVDVKFFFTLFDGTVREMFLFPGGYCSAKIMFRRSARSTLRGP